MAFPIRQLFNKDLPPLLQEIPEPPHSLYIRGTLPTEHTFICVVGSRSMSLYGRRICERLIMGLSGYPVVVVSGLALGMDACAHEAALAAGLPTVAVLPSSCDDASIYPSTHRSLAQRILESGGALLSENVVPYKPQLYDFPKRNRICAGLSKATLIVEAAEKSGTLITARLALDYNREVLAIPHELGSATGEGVNRLIREGATLVRNSEDILEALGLAAKPTSEKSLPTDLTDVERAVLTALHSPKELDVLIEETGLSTQAANIAISSLLLRGLLVERMGTLERV